MSGSRRVLVVEDDAGIRDMIEIILDSEGYEVVTATDGSMALELLEEEKQPDLILLDMRMPVMDGWEFARRYAELPYPKPPIVVVTAAQDASRRATEIAAQGFLSKPFGIDELLTVIDSHFAAT
jgi:CheY-like chemotaxis protein